MAKLNHFVYHPGGAGSGCIGANWQENDGETVFRILLLDLRGGIKQSRQKVERKHGKESIAC
jgi:hypothetical protein